MTELITYIFEFITMAISFFVTFLLFKQKKQSQVPLGNLFLIMGAFCVGIFALSTIVYSIIAEEWVIIAGLKIGMIAVLMAVMFLFYTMQVLIHSSKLMKINKISLWGPLIISVTIALVMIFTNYIEVIDATTAETHFEPFTFYLFAFFAAFMLLYSAFSMYHFGIRNNTGESKKRMQYFLIGLIFLIMGLITDAIGNLIEMEVLFDTLLFAFLSIGVIFVTLAFLQKKFSD